jgi:SAM-dependent methyltransferase
MGTVVRSDTVYVMGATPEERERLIAQAGLFAPLTERFLRSAGLAPGMRVLDIGCGVGDVSLLCAALVGPEGAVVGVDRDPAALGRARERFAALGFSNATFIEADYRELADLEPFDAVVGRAGLLYAADPVEAIRALLPHRCSGGLVAFHEFVFTSLVAYPASPLYDQLAAWWRQTGGNAGIELQMGLKLYAAYRAAGLPDPALHGETIMGGGPDFPGYAYLADTFRSILPLIERFGVATAEEVAVDTLAERLRDDRVGSGGILALQMIVGAAARKA